MQREIPKTAYFGLHQMVILHEPINGYVVGLISAKRGSAPYEVVNLPNDYRVTFPDGSGALISVDQIKTYSQWASKTRRKPKRMRFYSADAVGIMDRDWGMTSVEWTRTHDSARWHLSISTLKVTITVGDDPLERMYPNIVRDSIKDCVRCGRWAFYYYDEY